MEDLMVTEQKIKHIPKKRENNNLKYGENKAR